MPTNTQSMDYAGSSAPLLSEILTKVNNAKMKEDKVKVLKQNDSVPSVSYTHLTLPTIE